MSQLLQNKIRWLLGISVLALILISLTGGVVVYRLMGEVGNEAVRGTQATIALNRDMDDARVAFRTQVQEWKDLLLRGRDPQLRQKHYRAFRDRHDEVQAGLKRLADQMSQHGFSTAQVTQIQQAHLALLARYEAALTQFPLANKPDNYRRIDELVRGADRKLLADLQTLEDAIEQHVLEQVGTVNDKVQGRHLWQLSFVLAIMLVLFPLVSLVSFGAIGRMARRIQEEKERLHVTLHSIGDAVVVTDQAGAVEYLNPVAEAITGWPLEEARGRPLPEIFNIVNEDTRKVVANPVEIVLREGHVVGLANHTVLIARNGGECAIEDSAAPVRDMDGKLCGVVMVFQDATKQRKAKRLLHESEARLRAIIETAMDAVVQMDGAGIITGWNSQAEKVFGWTSGEAVGRALSETIIPPRHREAHANGLKRFLLTGDGPMLNSRVEVAGLHRDGREFPVELAIAIIKAEGKVASQAAGKYEFSAFIRDITGRKEAEAQLKASERRYRQIIRTSMDGFLNTDTTGRILDVNYAYCQLTGYAREELLDMCITDVEAKESQEDTAQHIQEIMTQGHARFETRHRRKDGQLLDIEVSVVHLPDNEDRCFFAFLRDITQRKQAEKELRLRAQLLDSVSDTIFLLDLGGNFIYLNEAAWKTRGYTRDEMMGIDLHILDTPKYEKLIGARFREVMEKGQSIFESEHRRKDGSVMPVEINARTIELDGHKRLLSIIRDITERKRAEETGSRRLDELEAIYLLSNAVGSAESPDQVYEEAMGYLLRLLGADRVAILLFDAGGMMRFRAWRELSEAYRKAVDGHSPWARDDNDPQPIFIEDINLDERYANFRQVIREEGISALGFVPLVQHGRLLGKFMVYFDRPHYFTEDEIQLALTIAFHVSFAIDQKQAEAEMAATNDRFVAMVNAIPDAIFFKDGEGRWLTINEPAKQLFRLHDIPWQGKTTMELAGLCPELREAYASCQASDDKTWKAGGLSLFEEEMAVAEGELRNFESRKVPIFKQDGSRNGLVIIGRDITERKVTEVALRLLSTELSGSPGEEFFAELARGLAMILTVDAAFVSREIAEDRGRLRTLALFMDGKARDSMEYPKAGTPCEFIKARQAVIFPAGASRRFPDDPLIAGHGIESYIAYPFNDASGHMLGHLGVMDRRPLHDQKLAVSLLKLFAMRVSAELQRRHAEQQFADIFEFAPDAIVMMDQQGIITLANRQTEKLFGYSHDDLIGQPIDILLPHDTRHELLSLRQKFLASVAMAGPANLTGYDDLRAMRKDGSIFPVEISLSPMEGQGGIVIAAAVRDVSERQQVVAQLLHTANELEQANAQIEEERAQLAARVAERTAQLVHANRAKDSFLATMSHEIRTPLGGLLGMLELIGLSRLDAGQREMLETARGSGEGLLRIVNDILDWSKIEAGKLELVPQAATIPEMVRGVASTYSPLASAKGLLLRLRIDDKLGAAHIFDPLRLSQILNNFTSNAIKFTKQGAVEISAVLVARHDGAEQVRFCVKDSGIGIGPEQQAHLFQRYEQANADTARMYGGTGLGLAICRSLAELMGGGISVESALGRGSTFCITVSLPLASQAVQRDVQLRQAGEGSGDDAADITPLVKDGRPASVLVVDDHPVNRMLIKRQLEQLGLHMEEAAHGAVALPLWRAGRFDMIITDCHMPEMDGYELTLSIREMERHDGRQRVPVIAWTANVLAEEEVRCRAAGMDDILTKPTELAGLRAMLLKWLAKTGVSFSEAPPPGMTSIDAAQNKSPADTPIDFSVLRKIATSRAAQAELLQEFNLYNRSDIASLKEALKDGNPAEVARCAHRIKGSSRMVGAVELAGICVAIEKAAAQDDLSGAQAVAGIALDGAIERIEAAISAFTAPQ